MNGRNDEGRERRSEGRGSEDRGFESRSRGNGSESYERFERPRNWRDDWGREDESWRGGDRPGRGEAYWESRESEPRGRESQRWRERERSEGYESRERREGTWQSPRDMSGREWRDRFGGADWEQPVYASRDPHAYGASEQEAAWGPRAGRTGRGWSGQEHEREGEWRARGRGSWGGLGGDYGDTGSPEYDYGQRAGYGRGIERRGGERTGHGPHPGGWGREEQGFGQQRYGVGHLGNEEMGRAWSGGASERRGGFAGRGPKNYQRSDQRVLEDVCQTLERHPDVDASEIEVGCERGEIVLRGSVDDRHMRRLAEQCIEDLPGVKDVRNELRVLPRGSQQQGEHGGLTGPGSIGSSGSASSGVSSGTQTGPAASTSAAKSQRSGERSESAKS